MVWREIGKNVYFLGVLDWDRELFDEFMPLPYGTSYNSYLVIGSEKTALIDTADPSKRDVFLRSFNQLNIEKLDYIVVNHAEQDHSGLIGDVLSVYPEAKVVTNSKCKALLKDLLGLEDTVFYEIADGERLSLGDKELEFIFTPWVHWPETMCSYLMPDGILFSCDLFGAHLADSRAVGVNNQLLLQSAKRYYAEIMMPFRSQIRNHLVKLSGYDIKLIAPSHGLLYTDPSFILSAYENWISEDHIEKKVVIAYVSMHGSSKVAAEYLAGGLMKNSVEFSLMNLVKTDIGEFSLALVDSAVVIFVFPYVLAKPHPKMVYALYLTNLLRPKLKHIGLVASYGWGGKGLSEARELLGNLNCNFFKEVLIKGYPKKEDFKQLDDLINQVVEVLN